MAPSYGGGPQRRYEVISIAQHFLSSHQLLRQIVSTEVFLLVLALHRV